MTHPFPLGGTPGMSFGEALDAIDRYVVTARTNPAFDPPTTLVVLIADLALWLDQEAHGSWRLDAQRAARQAATDDIRAGLDPDDPPGAVSP